MSAYDHRTAAEQFIELNTKFGLLLDECDMDILTYCKFHLSKSRNRDGHYLRDGKKHYLHRIIGYRIVRRPLIKVDYIDHINRNTLDNRRSNLRVCTNSDNLQNRGKQKNNTSGYAGVWFCKLTNKWAAEIKRDYKKIFLGRFDSAEEANRIRQMAYLSHTPNMVNQP